MNANNDDVRRILEDTLSRPLPANDADLWESGVIDSLAVMELVEALEQRFSVVFDADHLRKENFRSVAAIGALLERAARKAPQ